MIRANEEYQILGDFVGRKLKIELLVWLVGKYEVFCGLEFFDLFSNFPKLLMLTEVLVA